jgi:apolipoprotein N-acyltransferase
VALLFGSVRLAFFPAAAPTVRIAGLAPTQSLLESVFALPNKTPRTIAERAVARARFTPVVNDLLRRTAQEAEAGAKIIFWSEGASFVLMEDEQAVLEQARGLAQREGIYLQLGMLVMLANDHYPFLENRAIMIDPSGTIVWNYAKSHPTPGETGSVAAGPGIVPVVQTPYGRIATVICYDADFPQLVQQAGQKHVDILLDPSLDFATVGTTHDQMATVRAIENGVTLVRATSQGVSSAVNAQGRALASMDYFTTAMPDLVVSVPVQGTFTIYPTIGDSFAYLCVIGLLTLVVVAFIPRRKTKREPVSRNEGAQASGAPQPALAGEGSHVSE